MVEFFSGISSIITTLVDLVINLVSGIVQFFLMLPDFLLFYNYSVGLMPAVLIPFVLLGVSISLILLIIGRN